MVTARFASDDFRITFRLASCGAFVVAAGSIHVTSSGERITWATTGARSGEPGRFKLGGGESDIRRYIRRQLARTVEPWISGLQHWRDVTQAILEPKGIFVSLDARDDEPSELAANRPFTALLVDRRMGEVVITFQPNATWFAVDVRREASESQFRWDALHAFEGCGEPISRWAKTVRSAPLQFLAKRRLKAVAGGGLRNSEADTRRSPLRLVSGAAPDPDSGTQSGFAQS